MLGTAIHDPVGIEGAPGASVAGLGVLEVETTFGAEKVLALPSGTALGAKASGYEIHHGVVEGAASDFLGGSRVGNVFATMWHGSLSPTVSGKRFWPRSRPRSVALADRLGSSSVGPAKPVSTCWPTSSNATSTSKRCWS